MSDDSQAASELRRQGERVSEVLFHSLLLAFPREEDDVLATDPLNLDPRCSSGLLRVYVCMCAEMKEDLESLVLQIISRFPGRSRDYIR